MTKMPWWKCTLRRNGSI